MLQEKWNKGAAEAEETDPHPRPCIKPGPPGTPFEWNPGCADDCKDANLSWIPADQTYLARVTPSHQTMNDIRAYEFFAVNDANGSNDPIPLVP